LGRTGRMVRGGEDRECLEIVFAAVSDVPPMTRAVVIETSDLFLSDASSDLFEVVTLDVVRAQGGELAQREPDGFDRLLAALEPDAPVALISTSGPGPPP